MSNQEAKGLHTFRDRNAPEIRLQEGGGVRTYTQHYTDVKRQLDYQFISHYHPYVSELVKRLAEHSIPGLQDADTDFSHGKVQDAEGRDHPAAFYDDKIFTPTVYAPTAAVDMKHPPLKQLEFDSDGAYSVYNWELFYHVPLAVAIQLSKNGHYEEAQKWFHYIFDPTDDSADATPERFWKVWPLRKKDVVKIEEILINLSADVDHVLRGRTIDSITAWTEYPFRPHVVARYRQTPYMYKAVMAYLDNLIAWGDSLFLQDTGEAINEAMQIYVMAANILGPRPEEVPSKGTVGTLTYARLRGTGANNQLDAFSNALVDLESEIPFEIGPPPKGAQPVDLLTALRSLGKVLYFCVPRNDKLLGYWDTVADRLFKIRNSLNLQGVFRQLPLFEPPIDPALLVRAVAAGLDVGAVAAGLNQPLPLVRCLFLIQKAGEICAEVKTFGGLLLSALEKGDGEALQILRARHERQILELGEAVKYSQLQEATKAKEGVQKQLAAATARWVYYETLLGKPTLQLPDLDEVDNDALMKLSFQSTEPVVVPRDITVDIDPAGNALAEGNKLSHHETTEVKKLQDAQDKQSSASTMEIVASAMNIIPSFGVRIAPIGVGASINFGGSNIAAIFQAIAASDRGDAGARTFEANKSAKVGTFERRTQDWTFQSNNAANEITQLFKQLRAAQIREAVAKREWENHQQQIANAREIEQFLTDDKLGKTTNQSFYLWMKGEVKGLYSRCFQLAFETAKKAERALQHELGDSDLSYIQFDYLGGKETLLAGEKLYLDIKRMEMAYHDLNQREYELTKHVSLLELDARALLSLRASGSCSISLPEELFDLDGPGHYFRRLKSLALSLPCVSGPYVSVPCTLTLQRSSIRAQAAVGGDGYARTGSDDGRFNDHFGGLQSIVTSSAQNDSGLFEANLHDERFLPFERSGAISQWTLQLPNIAAFDYTTISDAVLHLRYTAREGGAALAKVAAAHFEDAITSAAAPGCVRLLSVRHDFPVEWARFKNAPAAARYPVTLQLAEEHYPFFSGGRLNQLTRVELFASGMKRDLNVSGKADGTGGTATLTQAPPFGKLRWGAIAGEPNTLPPPPPLGDFTFFVDHNSADDLWLVLTWSA